MSPKRIMLSGNMSSMQYGSSFPSPTRRAFIGLSGPYSYYYLDREKELLYIATIVHMACMQWVEDHYGSNEWASLYATMSCKSTLPCQQ